MFRVVALKVDLFVNLSVGDQLCCLQTDHLSNQFKPKAPALIGAFYCFNHNPKAHKAAFNACTIERSNH